MPRDVHDSLTLVVLVTPSFNVSATMGFVDPFRAANYLEGQVLFRWMFVSETGGPVRASNGTSIDTQPLCDAPDHPDFVIVSSSWTPEVFAPLPIKIALRHWARRGATLAGIDTGAFILADTGLMAGRRATVHYEHIDAFGELYPDIDVSETLFVFDGQRLTCCGGSACVDFALHLLMGTKGAELANAAARYILHPVLRDREALQNPDRAEPVGNTVPVALRSAIKVMELNLEDPLPIPDICEEVGLSQRQLTRLFDQYVRKSPALYYRDIRLDRARGFVTQTEMPMYEIAIASGFASAVHFSRAYKDRFGLPPGRDRIEGRIPFEFRAWPMHRRT